MRKLIFSLVFTLVLVLAGWLLTKGVQVWYEANWLMMVQTWLGWMAELFYVLTVVLTVVQVVSENGRPARTLAWVVVLILLPIAGIITYLLLGGNLRKEKLFTIKGATDLQRINDWLELFLSEWEPTQIHAFEALANKAPLVSLLTQNSKALLTEDNRAEVLLNGAQKFPRLFSDLKKARHHIHLEYYILEEGDLLEELTGILVQKVREGVPVRLIYDGVGSWTLGNAYLRRLTQAGIEVKPFMPVRFPRLANRINYRNHRKIAVIDGTIGYVGGLNVADRYLTGHPDLGAWRDTHLRIEGDAVKGLQLVFLTDWYFVSGQDIARQELFPSVEIDEQLPIQIVASGPDSDYAGILQGYFASIHLARKYLYISNAYLIPNESILTALKTAALSGVDIRILIPEQSDSKLAQWSTQSYLEELLQAGVRMYLYQAGFLHTKVLIADDVLSSVGTANWDHRSFEQNFEVNAFLYDRPTAETLKTQFLEDLQRARELSLEQFRQRPPWKKGISSLARLLSPLL